MLHPAHERAVNYMDKSRVTANIAPREPVEAIAAGVKKDAPIDNAEQPKRGRGRPRKVQPGMDPTSSGGQSVGKEGKKTKGGRTTKA